MSATIQRDRTSALAKSNPKKALAEARAVNEPWYRAQALSWVVRFTDEDPASIALEVARAARDCTDDYKRSAVRAWEIAALAERGYTAKACSSLQEAVALARVVEPKSSRSEALFLLFQAAFKIGPAEAKRVYETLTSSCRVEEHWRCARAIREGAKMISNERPPRDFFW